METCDVCGETIRIGEWPWCPHGIPQGNAIIPDTLNGGAQWIENLGETPTWVETKSQLRREAESRGLRWDPKPQPKGIKPHGPEADCRGRFNGGALPTFRRKDR